METMLGKWKGEWRRDVEGMGRSNRYGDGVPKGGGVKGR